MTVGELLHTVEYDNIWPVLQAHYNLADSAYITYQNAFEELCSIKPTPPERPMTLTVVKVCEEFKENKYYYDVFGLKDDDESHYSVVLTAWDKWLAFEVHHQSLTLYRADAVAAHSLWEAIFMGFSTQEVAASGKRIQEELAKAEKEIDQASYLSHHDVWSKLAAKYGLSKRTKEEKARDEADMLATSEENKRIYREFFAD